MSTLWSRTFHERETKWHRRSPAKPRFTLTEPGGEGDPILIPSDTFNPPPADPLSQSQDNPPTTAVPGSQPGSGSSWSSSSSPTSHPVSLGQPLNNVPLDTKLSDIVTPKNPATAAGSTTSVEEPPAQVSNSQPETPLSTPQTPIPIPPRKSTKSHSNHAGNIEAPPSPAKEGSDNTQTTNTVTAQASEKPSSTTIVEEVSNATKSKSSDVENEIASESKKQQNSKKVEKKPISANRSGKKKFTQTSDPESPSPESSVIKDKPTDGESSKNVTSSKSGRPGNITVITSADAEDDLRASDLMMVNETTGSSRKKLYCKTHPGGCKPTISRTNNYRLSSGAAAGLAISIIIVVGVPLALLFFFIKKRLRKNGKESMFESGSNQDVKSEEDRNNEEDDNHHEKKNKKKIRSPTHSDMDALFRGLRPRSTNRSTVHQQFTLQYPTKDVDSKQ